MSAPGELLCKLHQQGFQLTPNGNEILIEPASRLTDELRATIRANKSALLVVLSTLERRRARVVRQLQEHPDVRVGFDACNAPFAPETGEPVSVVLAIRTASTGIVSAELSVPRDRFDFVLFGQMIDETSRRPS
jgi:hypothetical protein